MKKKEINSLTRYKAGPAYMEYIKKIALCGTAHLL